MKERKGQTFAEWLLELLSTDKDIGIKYYRDGLFGTTNVILTYKQFTTASKRIEYPIVKELIPSNISFDEYMIALITTLYARIRNEHSEEK